MARVGKRRAVIVKVTRRGISPIKIYHGERPFEEYRTVMIIRAGELIEVTVSRFRFRGFVDATSFVDDLGFLPHRGLLEVVISIER